MAFPVTKYCQKLSGLSLISLAAALSAAFTFAQPAMAAQDKADENIADTELPDEEPAANDADHIVTASRTEQKLDETGQSVSILTKETIETRQNLFIGDILRQLPGVHLAQNGNAGSPASLFIRGADSAHSLVLIDGVRINDPSSPAGAFDFGHLLSAPIERIELLRGPNSVIWGSQAIGGVVNIRTTRPTEKFQLHANGEYGYRDTATGNASISGTSQLGGDMAISGAFGGSYTRTDGISSFNEARGGIERDGYDNVTLNGNINLAFSDNISLDLRGFYINSDVEFDNPPADSLPETDTEEFIGYAGLNFALFDGLWQNRIAYSRTDITRETRDPDPASFNPFDAKGTLNRYEYQGILKPADFAELVFGIEHEDSFSSTFFHAFDAAPDANSTGLTSYYGQAIIQPLSGLTLTGGVRRDDHDVFGGKTSFGGNFAYSINGGNTVFRATYAEGFRAPALSETLANFGNPNLEPETAKSYDVGVEQSLLGRAITARATWFHRTTRNLITYSAATFQLENIAKARSEGIELELFVRPDDRLTLSANYSHIDSTNLSDAPDFFGNVHRGNDLARRPEDLVNFNLDWQSPWRVALGMTLSVTGDSYDDLANNTPLDGYALLDVRASVDVVDNISLYGRIQNVTDSQYETAFQYGSTGRAAYIGARLNF